MNSNRHDSTSEYPKQQELIDLILKARIAFQRTSEGMRKFDELIEKVKDMTSSEFNRQLKNKLAAPIVDYRIQTVRSTYPTANNQGPTPQAGSWGAHDFQ